MPFLRLARDQRGYETTSLVHSAHPGERPRVLYWYRSAPGVRVGRPALDEDAIRTIEEQHPEIEFDWPQILEVTVAAVVEVDRRPERARGNRGADADRQRRRPARGSEPVVPVVPAQDATQPPVQPAAPSEPADDVEPPALSERSRVEGPVLSERMRVEGEEFEDRTEELTTEPPRAHDMLSELVGRDIATRLRARYAEINRRIHQLPLDDDTRAAWQVRAEPLNPDSWITPDEILSGVRRADELFDGLRRALLG